MEVNGWKLFQHPLFQDQYGKLLTEAERLKSEKPTEYKQHLIVKRLAKITELIIKEIPDDPGNLSFSLGNTIGASNREWKRAKFGRYRLFFRYRRRVLPPGKEEKIIVYAWVNDDKTQRKEGDKNDPYVLFEKGLKNGKPPSGFDALLAESKALELRWAFEE